MAAAVSQSRARSGYKLTQRQRLMDGLAVHLARTKTAKELNELFAVAETDEQKAVVRFAKKMKRDSVKEDSDA